MPFLLAKILNFQGSTHHIGVGSFSYVIKKKHDKKLNMAGSKPLCTVMFSPDFQCYNQYTNKAKE